jgi:hypothetical protein
LLLSFCFCFVERSFANVLQTFVVPKRVDRCRR